MKSRFPSKNACLTCGAEWKVGDEIYKIGDKYWCSNESCGGSSTGDGKAKSYTGKKSGKENHGMHLVPTQIKDVDMQDIANFNNWAKNIRLTCYELAKDLNPDGDDYSLRLGTAGLLQAAIPYQAYNTLSRTILDQTLVQSEILNTLRAIEKKLSK